jgi:succinate dehydrogenase / fumarate reductase flavoprotein subunit
MKLDARVPSGPIAEKWDRHKFEMKLVNPANKRKYTIICVGTGLAGASAAASLGEPVSGSFSVLRQSSTGAQHRRPGRDQPARTIRTRRQRLRLFYYREGGDIDRGNVYRLAS